MGAGAWPAPFVLLPLSRRAVRLIRQRHRRSVRTLDTAGRDRVPGLPRRHQARVGARRPVVGARSLRPQGAFHLDRVGTPAGLLGVLAAAASRRTRASPSRRDLGPCLHRLVELSDRTRHQQHQRLRVMTSSLRFRRFTFVFASAFAISYVVVLKLDLALFTVYPTIGVVLWGTHHPRDTVAPSMGSFLPAMYWYGWTASAALAALILGSGAALLPERCARWFWSGWGWMIPVTAMLGCLYLTLPWFRL